MGFSGGSHEALTSVHPDTGCGGQPGGALIQQLSTAFRGGGAGNSAEILILTVLPICLLLQMSVWPDLGGS